MKVFLRLFSITLMSVAIHAIAADLGGGGVGIVLNAEEDLTNGRYMYLLVGQPMAHDEQFKEILKIRSVKIDIVNWKV